MPYNLLEESWIPVKWKEDSTNSELGLRELILRSHEIEEIATDNPLETLSLNRLLLAIIASIYPELSHDQNWVEYWQKGKFNESQLNQYFEKYGDRFDLLSKERPFYGHPKTDAKESSPLTRLFHAAASGNNATLFSHDMDAKPKAMSLAEAARAVVCTQTIALGGGVAKPFNLSHAPMVAGALFWLRGTSENKPSLFRALLLNLPPTSEVWGTDLENDTPTWESELPPIPEKRDAKGLRDLLTFQSRRLQLEINENDAVTGVRYNQGSKLEQLPFHDPHMAYKEGKQDVFPLRFSVERSLWRDSSVYLMYKGDGKAGHAPRTFEWISQPDVKDYLNLSDHDTFQADVFGLVNDKAKIELWRQERITVYPEIINDPDRWSFLNKFIVDADNQLRRLKDAAKAFASRTRLNKAFNMSLGEIERRERDELAKSLAVDSRYWPAVGGQFPVILSKVAFEPKDKQEEVHQEWKQMLNNISFKALQSALEPYAQDARTWQALAEAEVVLKFGILYPKNKSTKIETL